MDELLPELKPYREFVNTTKPLMDEHKLNVSFHQGDGKKTLTHLKIQIGAPINRGELFKDMARMAEKRIREEGITLHETQPASAAKKEGILLSWLKGKPQTPQVPAADKETQKKLEKMRGRTPEAEARFKELMAPAVKHLDHENEELFLTGVVTAMARIVNPRVIPMSNVEKIPGKPAEKGGIWLILTG